MKKQKALSLARFEVRAVFNPTIASGIVMHATRSRVFDQGP